MIYYLRFLILCILIFGTALYLIIEIHSHSELRPSLVLGPFVWFVNYEYIRQNFKLVAVILENKKAIDLELSADLSNAFTGNKGKGNGL